MRIIFVLPSAGGGGGAHSVVQESVGLRRLGVDVGIATLDLMSAEFRARYPEVENQGIRNPTYAKDSDDLATVLRDYDLAIATTALSVGSVVDARAKLGGSRPRLGYYIQDYEPLFYPPGSREWTEAKTSFDLMKDDLLFAKTDWLCSVVEANHNIDVRRVQASIDHNVYYPLDRTLGEPFRITAMVRPKTPRRAPRRTIRVLENIAFDYGSRVEVSYFGCGQEDLDALGLRPSSSLTALGVLDRGEVANELRRSDLFLDLSDYQAFGRTGLEGMACGCVPVLPVFGGTSEYAKHGVNSYVVDTRSDEDILDAVRQFINGRPERKLEMRDAGIHTALNYSIRKAAYSEYKLFRDFLGDIVPAAAGVSSAAA